MGTVSYNGCTGSSPPGTVLCYVGEGQKANKLLVMVPALLVGDVVWRVCDADALRLLGEQRQQLEPG